MFFEGDFPDLFVYWNRRYPMRCDDVRKQLAAFSSGKLPMDVRQAMQDHLAECMNCRAAMAKVDALADVLAGTRTPPIPARLASRVMKAARLRREVEPAAIWNLIRWWRLTSVPMHAAAAAVLIFGLTVGLVLGWTSTPSTAQAATAAKADAVAAYQVDYLSEAPSGSLADSYLTLVLAMDEGGR